ncbi:hypothetical protein [Candidatus Poriferisodalis sp.]|uniref:hypothetical protein n=1 Tax=Candidatus Poriferisodalis sp. TaxID=3101277 RepID=UPI003B01BD3F
MNRTDVHDNLIDELRRANPVNADSLAPATDPDPAKSLEMILADGGDPYLPSRGVHRSRRMGRLSAPARQHWINAAAAAAVIVVVAAATVVVYDAGTGRDATAAVHQAVEATIAVSDSSTSSTTVVFDFDDFTEPWVLTVDATFANGSVAYRVTPGPVAEDVNVPQMDSYAEVIVDGQTYRSVAEGPWEGPIPVASSAGEPGSAIQSNLTFGVAIDDLGDLYDFVDVGDEILDGIAVAHYRTHTTPAGAGAGFLMSLGMFMMVTGQQPTEQLDRTQLDVWVDSDDLIRRVSYSAEIDGTGSFTVVTEWGDFGDAPPITAPTN